MSDQEFIGKRIAEVRRQRGMKQVDLGTTIGVTDQTISNWKLASARHARIFWPNYALSCSVPPITS